MYPQSLPTSKRRDRLKLKSASNIVCNDATNLHHGPRLSGDPMPLNYVAAEALIRHSQSACSPARRSLRPLSHASAAALCVPAAWLRAGRRRWLCLSRKPTDCTSLRRS